MPFPDADIQSHNSNSSIVITLEDGLWVLSLNPEDYPGGIAIWGALPAVLNTSTYPDDCNGVHVHARLEIGGLKDIDRTFDVVRVTSQSAQGQKRTFDINGEDAANYNISTILGKGLKYLVCPTCNEVHSDKGIDAVTYHTVHKCEHCGSSFSDSEPSISNAIMLLKETCGDVLQIREIIDPVDRTLDVARDEYKSGMQVWGSNPAVLWTSAKLEEGGIHFHGFQPTKAAPTIDDTYGSLTIHGILLDPEMTRYLMAQNALTHLNGKIIALICDNCGREHFDKLDLAVTPHVIHECEFCFSTFATPGDLACVSNPLVAALEYIKS